MPSRVVTGSCTEPATTQRDCASGLSSIDVAPRADSRRVGHCHGDGALPVSVGAQPDRLLSRLWGAGRRGCCVLPWEVHRGRAHCISIRVTPGLIDGGSGHVGLPYWVFSLRVALGVCGPRIGIACEAAAARRAGRRAPPEAGWDWRGCGSSPARRASRFGFPRSGPRTGRLPQARRERRVPLRRSRRPYQFGWRRPVAVECGPCSVPVGERCRLSVSSVGRCCGGCAAVGVGRSAAPRRGPASPAPDHPRPRRPRRPNQSRCEAWLLRRHRCWIGA